MAKKCSKAAPGQKGLTKEFTTIPRQTRITFEATGGNQSSPEYKPFVPGPNPELPEFIQQHSTPFDAKNDDYDVPAFNCDIVVDKAAPPGAIYEMHRYWSKKHWAAIRQYLRHYLPEKHYPRGTGLVLDCFSGSGMTGVAAMMEDRPCILIDASAAAAFISHCYTHPCDPDALRQAHSRMLTATYPSDLQKRLRKCTGSAITNLAEELEWLYATKCDRCGGKAQIEYVVYSERFQCPKCGEIVCLFDCPEAKVPHPVGGVRNQKIELKTKRVCPHCHARSGGDAKREYVISTRSKKFGATPVMVSYKCRDGCKPARAQRRHNEDKKTRKYRYFHECDLQRLKEIDKAEIPHPYPMRRMMDTPPSQTRWGVKYRAGVANFQQISELYVKRNLWALAAFKERCECEPLLLALTKSSMGCSRMNGNRKAGGGLTAGKFITPPDSRMLNCDERLGCAVHDIMNGTEAIDREVGPLGRNVVVHNSEAQRLTDIPDCTLDYIFTDPPYLNLEVQYGEMNFVWEAWLGFDSKWLSKEIAYNPVRGILWDEAVQRLRSALSETYRVLKPGRYASVCYHDTSERNWSMLQDAILDAGFEVVNVLVLDPKQKSQDQTTKEKVVKSDLVLNCRKPRPGDSQRDGNEGDITQVSRRVRDILVETLAHTGGQARDRLWDIVLRRLLTRGQMAEHRFDDILAEVAFRSELGRWFLKEEYESLSQSDIKNEEAAGEALVRFARLRCTGVAVSFAAQIALATPRLAQGEIDEREVESHIKNKLIDDKAIAKKFELGGRMKGVEFYDCLFFYLTRFLKGRSAGQTPRRNLAEFLEEYLVRFKDGDKWLYRVPDSVEAEALRKSRQTGLGRRIRQYVSFLRGEGEFPAEKRPDSKTLVAWIKHCANFGLADEGVLLFEKGGMAGFLGQLAEEDRYDAEDYYAQCRRKASKPAHEDDDIDSVDTEDSDEE